MISNVIFLSVIFAKKRTSSEKTMKRELIKNKFLFPTFKGILFKRNLTNSFFKLFRLYCLNEV